MTLIVLVVVGALVFLVGLLLGQEWNRRAVNEGRRRLVVAHRERDDLVQMLRGIDEHHRPR